MTKKEEKSFLVEKLTQELTELKEELRNDVAGPVIASFGFIIALIWRDAIQAAIHEFLSRAGLLEEAYIYQIISAIIITIIVVFIMVIVVKLRKKKKKKRVKQKLQELEKDKNTKDI